MEEGGGKKEEERSEEEREGERDVREVLMTRNV